MLVTEEQINQFHEDGAILLKNAFRKIALILQNNKISEYTMNGFKIWIFDTMNQFTFQSKLGGFSKRWNWGMKYLVSMRSVYKIPVEKLAKSEQIFWETGSQSRAGDEHGLIFLHFSPLVNTGSLFQWLLQLAENPRIQRLRILFSCRGTRCQHDAIKIRSLLSRARSQQGDGWRWENK